MWRTAASELHRSLSKRAFVKAAQRLIPDVRSEDFIPATSGVRAQAAGEDGTLIDDFVITTNRRVLNVLNAPSPAGGRGLPSPHSLPTTKPGAGQMMPAKFEDDGVVGGKIAIALLRAGWRLSDSTRTFLWHGRRPLLVKIFDFK